MIITEMGRGTGKTTMCLEWLERRPHKRILFVFSEQERQRLTHALAHKYDTFLAKGYRVPKAKTTVRYWEERITVFGRNPAITAGGPAQEAMIDNLALCLANVVWMPIVECTL